MKLSSGRVIRVVVRLWKSLLGAWRRSIQLRVITVTLALSVVVVTMLGITVSRQILDGLLRARADSAVADTSAGVESAQRQLDAASDIQRGGLNQLLREVVEDLAARAGSTRDEPLYEVVLMGQRQQSAFSSGPLFKSVPNALRQQVSEQSRIFRTYTSIVYPGERHVAGLIVGGKITAPTGDEYELYYLFPLTEQQQTIDLVRNALAAGGILLVLLLGALSWLVARQVVTPVRLAARVAARFSAGELSERMPVRGHDDDLAQLAMSFNHMAASLQHQINQLEELSRMQQRFVSDVSHELRTPLTTVRMAADVVYETRSELNPTSARSVVLLQTQLDRFEALLSDLLEIGRFDAGAAILTLEAHDVRDLIRRVVEESKPLASAKNSAIKMNLPTDPCVIDMDERRVERVIRNLVTNAIEHGEGRDIHVAAAMDEHAVAVTVRDFGVGLKPGESSLVFHRFWRADPARARTTGGTGLGLSISLEDTRLHKGWLQAWGEPGKGALFRLTLPRDEGVDLRSSPLSLVPDDDNTQVRTRRSASP